MTTKDSFFVPENAIRADLKEYTSDSFKYRLEIIPYRTRQGSWNYCQGLVYKAGEDTPIADVRRNYHSFPYSFIEDHPNGHDYLVCGENYQGQTVIELDTGKRLDFLPEAAKKGHGFCWAQHEFDANQQILVVDGCFWAAGYEYKFYDFSNPMSGWPEIEIEEGYASADEKWPLFHSDGTITCYEQREDEEAAAAMDPNSEEDPPKLVVATKTYRRDGLKLVLVDSWIDEKEQKERQERRARQEAWNKKWDEYKATDPLYILSAARIVAEPFIGKDEVSGYGRCYDGWHPTEKFDDTRICRRVASNKMVDGHKITIDIEWGMKTAPIKVDVYVDDSKSTNYWFPHSVEGMTEAYDFAKSKLESQ